MQASVYCVARKRLELWRFLHACGMKTVFINHDLDKSVSNKTVGRLGLENDQRSRNRMGARSSLHPKNWNEGSMYCRACISDNSQLSPRRLQEEELNRGQIENKWTSCKDETPASLCQETGKVVGYILFF
jgi:hypothetical protein